MRDLLLHGAAAFGLSDYVIVDCRYDYEHQGGRLPGGRGGAWAVSGVAGCRVGRGGAWGGLWGGRLPGGQGRAWAVSGVDSKRPAQFKPQSALRCSCPAGWCSVRCHSRVYAPWQPCPGPAHSPQARCTSPRPRSWQPSWPPPAPAPTTGSAPPSSSIASSPPSGGPARPSTCATG